MNTRFPYATTSPPAPVREPAPSFDALLDRTHAIGRSVASVHAGAVDAAARFPREAIDALKTERLLGCYVPAAHGGLGLSFAETARLCEVLGHYCASTAMVFAMHQIQVGCIVHHALGSPWFQRFVRELTDRQLLLASATTEVGIGGDVRSSRCALEVSGERFSVVKQAPVISYALDADAILVTCRRTADAPASDQLHVLVRTRDCSLVPLSGWDTLGFRGTCSAGFTLEGRGDVGQVLPAPYADIHARTMHPFSHVVWSALWLGIANDAVNTARTVVRSEARKTPGTLPPSAMRLAELDATLFAMRGAVYQTLSEYQDLITRGVAPDLGFSLRASALKVSTSRALIDVVGQAMTIGGISAYRNDSRTSLGRHLRDAYGAGLMVNNDRILGQNSALQIMQHDL